MKSGEIRPALAEQQARCRAGECWASYQEMTDSKKGDYPHGVIDECDNGITTFFRVWHDGLGVWYNAD